MRSKTKAKLPNRSGINQFDIVYPQTSSLEPWCGQHQNLSPSLFSTHSHQACVKATFFVALQNTHTRGGGIIDRANNQKHASSQLISIKLALTLSLIHLTHTHKFEFGPLIGSSTPPTLLSSAIHHASSPGPHCTDTCFKLIQQQSHHQQQLSVFEISANN